MAVELANTLLKEYMEIYNGPDLTAEKLSSLYCKDSRIFPNGKATVVGRDALRERMTESFKKRTPGTRLDVSVDDAHLAGDFIICSGVYKYTSEDKVVDDGTFSGVYKKEDGKWKIFYDTGNPHAY